MRTFKIYSLSNFQDKTQYYWDFRGGAVVKNPPASAGDTGSNP